MTVSAQTPINRSTGNGVTTVFPYTFKIISSADIEVTVDGVAKTLNVDYTVSGAGVDAGGNVTMAVAPANLTSVVRQRSMALVRTTDYQDQGEMPAETIDTDFDSAVLMIQQVDAKTSRALLIPVDVSGFSAEFPTPVASNYLRVNPTATAMEMVSAMEPGTLAVSPYIETLLDDLNEAAARATLGSTTVGDAVFVAANEATARTAIGALSTTDIAADSSKLGGVSAASYLQALRGRLYGCQLSTAGVSAIMSISAGIASDSTGTAVLSIAAFTKSGGSWAVGTGNGGMDTGTFTANAWYHWYLIRRPDTGVVDAIFSMSASAPTLPTNYTQYRRIGSAYAIAGVVWRKFFQTGDTFEWDVSIFDVGVNNPGASAIIAVLSVPLGVVTEAIVNAGWQNSGTGVSGNLYLSNPAKSDEAPSDTAAPLWGGGALSSNATGGASRSYTQQRVFTNTLSQIRHRSPTSDASVTVRIATLGWVDTRGRNA